MTSRFPTIPLPMCFDHSTNPHVHQGPVRNNKKKKSNKKKWKHSRICTFSSLTLCTVKPSHWETTTEQFQPFRCGRRSLSGWDPQGATGRRGAELPSHSLNRVRSAVPSEPPLTALCGGLAGRKRR